MVRREPMLRPQEVAERLSLHMNTVKRIDRALLPFIRVTARGDRRYRVEDVEAYVAHLSGLEDEDFDQARGRR